jgi:hypothetical protein
MKSMRKVLKLIPDLKFDLVESSCCGMAGTFGIEKEHTAMAMQMAELSLLPALRQQPDAAVVANGFSCRHQIREGCDHQPMHIAVLLRDAMILEKAVIHEKHEAHENVIVRVARQAPTPKIATFRDNVFGSSAFEDQIGI